MLITGQAIVFENSPRILSDGQRQFKLQETCLTAKKVIVRYNVFKSVNTESLFGRFSL